MPRWVIATPHAVLITTLCCVVCCTSIPASKDAGSENFSSAISYLGDLRDEGARAIAVMVGGSSLTEIGLTLRSVREKENNSYREYSTHRPTTAKTQDVAEQIDQVHQAFQESVDELILGSDGPYQEHIEHGGDAFKHSLELANAVLVRINSQRPTP